ncbi:hypothetical protein K435DRAFT_778530, partial [Dendrothele bispora CBS 962.96]
MLPLDFSAGSGGEFRPRFPSSSFLAHSHVQIGWEKRYSLWVSTTKFKTALIFSL